MEEEEKPYDFSKFRAAIADFTQARQQAAMQGLLARLTGRSTELLSYEEVAEKLHLTPGAEAGRREIPLDAIVGSVGRYTDFSRTFLPLRDFDQRRWAGVKAAVEGLTGVPPIDVYQVGEIYFVRDGNHRVSVARQSGATQIEANVIEVPTRVPLTPDVKPDDLIIKSEYAAFLEQTGLAELRPSADLSVTVPGQYDLLKEHIEVHRYYMGLDQQRDVSYAEALAHWYDAVYMPRVLAIRESGLLRGFPDRTETDLYLWVSEHHAALQEELGWQISPEAAVTDLAVKQRATASPPAAVGGWRKAKLTARYTDRLFSDILVPLGAEPASLQALDQALYIARREAATLHGLHVVPNEAQKEGPDALTLQTVFNERCEELGVPGSLAIETGEVARKICERALLADLVVLNVAHPPEAGLAGLGSGLRTIIWRCARPVLTVPGWSRRTRAALLAYDGSSKAKEALFVAAYLAERWHIALTVLTAPDGVRVTSTEQDFVHKYLDFHEIQANFIQTGAPPAEAILQTVREQHIGLIMMGGYSANPVKEVILGSTVNQVLRETHVPVFICR